jgi:hypothetical protein
MKSFLLVFTYLHILSRHQPCIVPLFAQSSAQKVRPGAEYSGIPVTTQFPRTYHANSWLNSRSVSDFPECHQLRFVQ